MGNSTRPPQAARVARWGQNGGARTQTPQSCNTESVRGVCQADGQTIQNCFLCYYCNRV